MNRNCVVFLKGANKTKKSKKTMAQERGLYQHQLGELEETRKGLIQNNPTRGTRSTDFDQIVRTNIALPQRMSDVNNPVHSNQVFNTLKFEQQLHINVKVPREHKQERWLESSLSSTKNNVHSYPSKRETKVKSNRLSIVF